MLPEEEEEEEEEEERKKKRVRYSTLRLRRQGNQILEVAPKLKGSETWLMTTFFSNILCKTENRIHSNKRPGNLDKPFWVGAYCFTICCKNWPQTWMILTCFRLIPSHIELSI